ncbi:hypothetical protein GQ457_01G012300 [Hibiscus cannabinus]
MAAQLNIVLGMSIISVLLMLEVEAQAGSFSVLKYGAKADGKTDMSKAFLDAFKAACASRSAAKVLIPKGSFLLSGAQLEGPCKGPIEFLVEGTVMAPPDIKAFKEPLWISFKKITNFKMSGGGIFDGKGAQAYKREGCVKNDYCKHLPINLRFDFLTNAMIQDITSKDAKQFHVNVLGCKNITFDKLTITAPKESPNTDGIHIGRSTGVKVLNTKIGTGDDCVSFGDGSENVLIKGVTCGPGHGISIGSLGLYQKEDPVKGITISGCTLTNTKNGVRIKTWPNSYPGIASDMHFEDITVRNVDYPIIVDQKYCPWNRCNLKAESKVKLSNISFKNIRGTATQEEAIKIICSATYPCQNVELGNIDIKLAGKGTAKSVCTNVKPKLTGKQSPPVCTGSSKASDASDKASGGSGKASGKSGKASSSKKKSS